MKMETIKGKCISADDKSDAGIPKFDLIVKTEDYEFACNSPLPAKPGKNYIIFGRWIDENKIFKASYAIPDICYDLESKEDLVRFLVNEIEGFTQQTAEAAVELLGTSVIKVLENDPKELLNIEGITKAELNLITTSFKRFYFGQREVIIFLAEIGFGVNEINEIIEKLYDDNKKEIPQNTLYDDPFYLYYEIDTFPFESLEKIITALGEAPDSPKIEGALLVETLRVAEQSGHTYLSYQTLRKKTEKAFREYKNRHSDEKFIFSEAGVQFAQLFWGKGTDRWIPERQVVYEKDTKRVYLYQIYWAEKNVAAELLRRSKDPFFPYCFTPAKIANETLDSEQKAAVRNCCQAPVSIITGGPGTGKTSVIKSVIETLEANCPGIDIVLCAPTGKAAKRMQQQTGSEAQTIHRIIYTAKAKRDIYPGDFFILDECSMLSIKLLSEFLSCIDEYSKLLFVGDPDQLLPIGAGKFLSEAIDSEYFPVTELKKVYRQKNNGIPKLAGCIRDGNRRFPFEQEQTIGGHNLCKASDSSVLFYEVPDKDVPDIVSTFCKQIRAHGETADSVVLSSYTSNGKLSAAELNLAIQKENKKPEFKLSKSLALKIGDRVIHTHNDYELARYDSPDEANPTGAGVYNGETGTVVDIRKSSKPPMVIVKLDDDRKSCYVKYTNIVSGHLDLAYALTVHKSQGSEYKIVIIPIQRTQRNLTRRLLYTAVTRAREKCILIGGLETYIEAVSRTDPPRNSTFPQRLQETWERMKTYTYRKEWARAENNKYPFQENEEETSEDEFNSMDVLQKVKALYRKIVKKLHPDCNTNFTERDKELWNMAQKAYKESDVRALEMIYNELKTRHNNEEKS